MLFSFFKINSFKRFCSGAMAGVFLFSFLLNSYAQSFSIVQAPILTLNQTFHAPVLKGIKVDNNNPLSLEFILDKGDSNLSFEDLKQESARLIKYFLASITIPEEDLWVNLSPYEKDRIVPNSFGETQMGRDLLTQDYLLKQITASLFNPDSDVGKPFWKAVYQKIQDKFGTIDVPVDVFNKVWIVPQKAIVYENTADLTAYVLDSKLRVITESDYLAMTRNTSLNSSHTSGSVPSRGGHISTDDSQSIIKEALYEIIIPVLEKEINEGRSFTQLRQIYQSLILATWYKKRVTKGALYEVYANKNKVLGVDIERKEEIEEIWERYVQVFKRGSFNFIRQELDPLSEETIERKYFSGGVVFAKEISTAMSLMQTLDPSLPLTSGEAIKINTDLSVIGNNDDEAMSDILIEEFKFRFPKNYDLMLAMFGELLLTDSALKDFFYRLVSDEKQPMTEQRAQYIASLLRIEKQEFGEDQGYPLYFKTTTQGEIIERKIQYTDLDQDFINWALKMNLPLEEFSIAYGFYVERKEEERVRQGSHTISRIRAGNKMGNDVFKRVIEQRESYRQPSLIFFRPDLVSTQGLRWINTFNLSQFQADYVASLGIDIKDFRIAISAQEAWAKDSFEIYLFTTNRTFIDKTVEIIKEPLPSSVPLIYAQIQILNGIPTITAFQPRFRLPHSVDHQVKKYIEDSMKTLGYLLEANLEEIIQAQAEKLRFLTPSFFMMGLKTKESTLQHYYSSIPRELGYVIRSLPNPIRGLFHPIHFVFEKKLKDNSATISKDQIRFLSSKDLEVFLDKENKKDTAIARRILANRIILLAMRKAQRNHQMNILSGLKKAHDGLTIGEDIEDIFSTQAWIQYLKKYVLESFQIALSPDETGLSQEVILTNDDSFKSEVVDSSMLEENILLEKKLPNYIDLQQEVREALRKNEIKDFEHVSVFDFFQRPKSKNINDLIEKESVIVFSDHLDVDSFVSSLTMSYLLHSMLSFTDRGDIPVVPVFYGNREQIDPSIVAILDLVFPGKSESFLESLIFIDNLKDIIDLKEHSNLVQVDSSGYPTWLTIDHHKAKKNTQAGVGSRIIPGASAAFLISQEYHKLKKAGFLMPREIAWLTLYSIMSDTVFFSENMVGDHLYQGVNQLILPIIGRKEIELAKIFQEFRDVAYNIDQETSKGFLRDTKAYEVGDENVLVTQRFFYDQKAFLNSISEIIEEMQRQMPSMKERLWLFIGTDVDERTSYVFFITQKEDSLNHEFIRQVLGVEASHTIAHQGHLIHLRPEMLRKHLMESLTPSLQIVLNNEPLPEEMLVLKVNPESFETSEGIIHYALNHRWGDYGWAGMIQKFYHEKNRTQYVRALEFLLKHIDPALREGASWICSQLEWIGPVDIALTKDWNDRSLTKVLIGLQASDEEKFFEQFRNWYKDFLMKVQAEGKFELIELIHAVILGIFKNETVKKTTTAIRAEKVLHLVREEEEEIFNRELSIFLSFQENKTASIDQTDQTQEKDASQKHPAILLAVGRIEYQQSQYIVKHQQRKQPFKGWMSLARSIFHIYEREFDKLLQSSVVNETRLNISSIIENIQNGLAENVSQILSMRISEIYRRLSVMRSAIKENKPNIFIDSANGLNQLSWSKEPELEGVYTQMRVALRIVRDRGIQQETIPFILKALDEAEKRLKLNEGLKRLFYSYQKEYVIQRNLTKNLSYEEARDIAFELTINKEDLLTEPDQMPRILLLFYQLIFVSAREHPEFFKKISSYIHHRPLRGQEDVVKNDAERLEHVKPSSVSVPQIILDAWDMFSPSIPKNEVTVEKDFQEGGIDLMINDENFLIQYANSQEDLWVSDEIISQSLKGITGVMPMRVDLQHMSTTEITAFLSAATPL